MAAVSQSNNVKFVAMKKIKLLTKDIIRQILKSYWRTQNKGFSSDSQVVFFKKLAQRLVFYKRQNLETHETLRKLQNPDVSPVVDSKSVQTNIQQADIIQLINSNAQTKSETFNEPRELDNLKEGDF